MASLPPSDNIKVVKKEVFKHLLLGAPDSSGGSSSDPQPIYNSFLLLAVVMTQILLSLCAVEEVVRGACVEGQQCEGKEGILSIPDRKMIERRHDQVNKKIAAEF